MRENDQGTPARDNRKGNLLLLGAIGLVLLPVVVGWVAANRGGESDTSGSGMGGAAATSTSDAVGFPVRPIDDILE